MSIAIENSWKRLAGVMTAGRGIPETCNRELPESERNLLASLPGCVSVHRANGEVVWSNAQFCELFAGDGIEPTGHAFLTPVNPQDRVVVSNALADAASCGDEQKSEFRHSGSCGGVRTFELQCSRFAVARSEATGSLALAIWREIPDTRAECDALKARLRESEIAIAERNRFFASMSHELRTPLNAIIGFSELLEGKAAIRLTPDKQLEYAGIINDSANHLLSLINDVLDLSKLEEGKQECQRKPLQLRELLETTVRAMMPIAMEKRIDLVLDCDTGFPPVMSDERVLRQIFTNLLSNAVKFSDRGSEVRIKVVRLRNRYKISVVDHGIGMDAETLARLGGLFYQSGDVVSGDYGGTGLGLSIVYKLVELAGGKIAVSSRPGKGTAVSVVLPTGVSVARPVPGSGSDDIVYLQPPQTAGQSTEQKLEKQKGVST